MNKYPDESAEAQEKRRRAIMCERKRAFQTVIQARQPGVGVYKCPYCHLYHRTASLAKLAAALRRARPR